MSGSLTEKETEEDNLANVSERPGIKNESLACEMWLFFLPETILESYKFLHLGIKSR